MVPDARSPAPTLEVWTLPEVARICRVSLRTARAWVKRGKLSASRPGRAYLVRREVVEAMLRQERRP